MLMEATAYELACRRVYDAPGSSVRSGVFDHEWVLRSCRDNTITETETNATRHETAPATMPKPKRKRIRLKTERRREQCRRNQERYRNKQRLCALELELAVDDLKRQIERLDCQHRSLYNSVNLREASVNTIMEHFRLFRQGLDINSLVTSQNTTYRQCPTLLDQQLAFLDAVMTNDLRVGEAFGREKLVEQQKLFSMYYDDLFLRLFGLDCISIGPEDLTTVHATLEVEMTITQTTIRRVFPHLQDSMALRWKLLGLRLCCPASATFQFDKTQFITSVDWTIDFLTGFSGVLTIEEVVLVLQNARIAYDAYLDPEHHYADLVWPTEEAIGQQAGAIDDLTRVRTEPSPWQSECEWRNDYTCAIMFHDGQEDDFVMV